MVLIKFPEYSMVTDNTYKQIHIRINVPITSVPSISTTPSLFNTQNFYYSFQICYVLMILYSFTYNLFDHCRHYLKIYNAEQQE